MLSGACYSEWVALAPGGSGRIASTSHWIGLAMNKPALVGYYSGGECSATKPPKMRNLNRMALRILIPRSVPSGETGVTR